MSAKNTGSQGSLEVICGPMFSGKSEELIRRLRRAHIAKQHVITFKHSADDRYKAEQVVSHNGTEMQAVALHDPEHILTHPSIETADVVGIDEAQFFSKNLVSVICKLIDKGKRILVAGLDLDHRGVPFNCMPTLLAIADSVTKLRAICTICHKDALMSQRLIDGKPPKWEDPVILPGAQELYQARCRNCHEITR